MTLFDLSLISQSLSLSRSLSPSNFQTRQVSSSDQVPDRCDFTCDRKVVLPLSQAFKMDDGCSIESTPSVEWTPTSAEALQHMVCQEAINDCAQPPIILVPGFLGRDEHWNVSALRRQNPGGACSVRHAVLRGTL